MPRAHFDAVVQAFRGRVASLVIGEAAVEGVQVGALASLAQHQDIGEQLARLAQDYETLWGAADGFAPRGDRVAGGVFFALTLLGCTRRTRPPRCTRSRPSA